MQTDVLTDPLSKVTRILLVSVGTLSLGTGIVGIFVPLLPTTVFVLIAAACYARSSPRFHQALRKSRAFGPMIHDWEEHRSVSRKTKRVATASILLTFGVTILFFVSNAALRLGLIAFALVLVTVLLRLPTREVVETTSEQADA